MHEKFLRESIELARSNMQQGRGGPFGAIVVKDGQIVGRGGNGVTSTNDPTAHAEVSAIRDACQRLGTFQLDGCILYSSCEPCPMCLGAIYWARPQAVYFAAGREDAAHGGFDDALIYEEIPKKTSERQIPTQQLISKEGARVFEEWIQKVDKIKY